MTTCYNRWFLIQLSTRIPAFIKKKGEMQILRQNELELALQDQLNKITRGNLNDIYSILRGLEVIIKSKDRQTKY